MYKPIILITLKDNALGIGFNEVTEAQSGDLSTCIYFFSQTFSCLEIGNCWLWLAMQGCQQKNLHDSPTIFLTVSTKLMCVPV